VHVAPRAPGVRWLPSGAEHGEPEPRHGVVAIANEEDGLYPRYSS
jgi:hypothetical protein